MLLKVIELMLDELDLSQIFGGLNSTCGRRFLWINSLFGAELLDSYAEVIRRVKITSHSLFQIYIKIQFVKNLARVTKINIPLFG